MLRVHFKWSRLTRVLDSFVIGCVHVVRPMVALMDCNRSTDDGLMLLLMLLLVLLMLLLVLLMLLMLLMLLLVLLMLLLVL